MSATCGIDPSGFRPLRGLMWVKALSTIALSTMLLPAAPSALFSKKDIDIFGCQIQGSSLEPKLF